MAPQRFGKQESSSLINALLGEFEIFPQYLTNRFED